MSTINRKLAGNVLKVAIVLLASATLFLSIRKFLSDESDVRLLRNQAEEHPVLLVAIILLMPINWFLETAKWKSIIAVREEISWREAWSGVLSGLAIGAATPNRIGEFAGRIFQLKKATIYEGISCTMVCSIMQVTVTIIAGISGLLLIDTSGLIHRAKAIVWSVIVGSFIIIFVVVVRNVSGKFRKYVAILNAIRIQKWLSIFALSGIRYAIYSLQFFLMLRLFGIDANAGQLIGAIAVNYLAITIIPSIMVSELFIRGSVASAVIGVLCGKPEVAAVAAVILWLLNIGVPALSGLFFVRNIFLPRTKQ